MAHLSDELITLDGFPLTGTTRDGDWKRLGNLPGWWDRPGIKRRSQSRSVGDGSFKTPIEYDNRLITINGRVQSSNHDYLHQAAGIITSLGLRGGAKLLVDGHGPAQWALVDPRDEVTCEFETDTYLRFQIPLEAIDPFKYGESYSVPSSGGSAALYHRGTVPAWPVITVSGAAAVGYTLTFGGRSVVVTAPLVSGTSHIIDYRTGILRVGSSVNRGGLSTANFRPVQPGMPQTMSISAGSFTAKYNDTYI